MPLDRFMIAPLGEGLVTDVRPWLIPDTAFSSLNNAYVWRGRVKKRVGKRLLAGEDGPSDNPQLNSRLRVEIGMTNGIGNFSGTVPGTVFAVGQLFSTGSIVFTVNATGSPAPLITNGVFASGDFDTATGAVNIVGGVSNVPVYFYPALPVMGFANPEAANVNDEPTVVWDTQFAYIYDNTGNGGYRRLSNEAVVGDATWSGDNSQFFWSTNYKGTGISNQTFLFTTNYNVNENYAAPPPFTNVKGMRALNIATETWQSFKPLTGSAARGVATARIIVPFQGRLLLLNTIETIDDGASYQTYQNRVRYSRLPLPTTTPFDATFFLAPNGLDNNFLDNLGTTEAIISVEFIKNRLIVFYERSTWELVFTGNSIDPFRWQQINTELGVESTFSVVPFDKIALGIGNTGVHACNGANVERIDQKIPNFVFNIHNDNNGVFRVHGIRDYYRELVYWTVPEEGEYSSVFPRQLLVYNYQNQTWSLFNDSFTAFGYFQQTNDLTWGSTNETWSSTDWTWGGAFQQARFRNIITGNQEGFTFLMDDTRNDPGLQITDIAVTPARLTITCINHNLIAGDPVANTGDLVKIDNASLITGVNGFIFQVSSVIDNDTFTVDSPDPINLPFGGTYFGNGVLTLISPINITTKQYNFYVNRGRNAIVSKVDFLVDKIAKDEGSTLPGNIQVNFYLSSGADNMVNQAASGALLGTSLLECFPYDLVPFERQQTRVWHPLYFQAVGEVIQLQLLQTNALFINQEYGPELASADFQLHAMIFYARQDGRLQ